MNTELQAMIDAGRKLIAEQATAEQRKTAHADAGLSTVTLTVTTPGEVETLRQAVTAVTAQCGRARPETCREVSPWK